jgi:hypothetical protein
MMLKPYDSSESESDRDPVPPECRATVERIQHALDGEVTPESLDTDPDTHATTCPACRERIRAARVLLSALAASRKPVAVPAGFADRIVTAMQKDRQAHTRRTVYRVAAWVAVAAAVLLAVFAIVNKPWPNNPTPQPFVQPGEVVKQPEKEIAPPPREKVTIPTPAPDPRPIRIGDEFAKAGQTILEAPKPLTETVAVAPKLLEAIPNPFKLPAAPPDPMANALEPARKSLTDLPSVARTGLEPVTGTAEKAFKRFLLDVGAVKPNS